MTNELNDLINNEVDENRDIDSQIELNDFYDQDNLINEINSQEEDNKKEEEDIEIKEITDEEQKRIDDFLNNTF